MNSDNDRKYWIGLTMEETLRKGLRETVTRIFYELNGKSHPQ